MTEIFLVWKVPKERIDAQTFHEVGIYPSGELMGVFKTEDEAEELISDLEDHSPSDRFGETMRDAPYQFTISVREI